MYKAVYGFILFCFIVGGFVITPQQAEAQNVTTSLLELDFEGSNDPAAVLNNPNASLLAISGGSFAADGKTNVAGASASGVYATVSAFESATVSGVNVTPKVAQSNAARTTLNSLPPGEYEIRLSFDYDIRSRNVTTSPHIFLRLFGQSAITGTNRTQYIAVSQYVDNRTIAPIGDGRFEHYSVAVPIRVLASSDAANEDGNGKADEFVAGRFEELDLRIGNFSNPGTGNPSVIDFDNITVEAILTSEPPLSAEATFISDNASTQGNWIGVYGSSGYVLPFYTTMLSYGRDNPLAPDVALLPSYVSSYSAYGSNYWNEGNPTTDIRALRDPAFPLDNSKRKKINVYSGTTFEQAFQLTDNEKHLFTIYTTDFGSVDSVVAKFELLDMQNNLLAEQTASSIQNGVYLTFEVRGSFKLKATKLAGANVSVQGYFFDEMLEQSVSNIAAVYTAPRNVQLTWDNDDTDQDVVIERKQFGDAVFTTVGVAEGDEVGYLDVELEAGTDYVYRLRSVREMKYSEASGEVMISVPAYHNIDFQFTPDAYTVEEPGEAVELSVVLLDAFGSPLAGKEIGFELRGPYVGVQIPRVVGAATTDGNGLANLTYLPPYAGQFVIAAHVPYDDMELLSGGEALASLTVHDAAWDKPPVILNMSDAVKPDGLLSIRGYGMKLGEPADIQVLVKAATGAAPSPVPPVDAIALEKVQLDTQSGYFVTARLDEQLAPGLYDVWVSNAFGWSEPARLNAPRPLFQSGTEAYAGIPIELSGRNFASSEFGASTETLIRLTDDASTTYIQTISKLTPYSLRFELGGNVPTGDYDVEVSNDNGESWSRVGSGQRLTVVPAGDDPLGLQMAWASNFAWDSIFDVSDYGAVANDGQEDTMAIQAAIAAAKSAGGGVVYLSAGAYHASSIDLPAGVVLMGEDENTTELYHTGGSGNFIRSAGDGKSEGRHGVARLTLKLADPNKRPDSFIWIGHDWGTAVTDYTQRTASALFIQNVNIEYPIEKAPPGTGRGIAFTIIADRDVLVANNQFTGYYAASPSTYVTRYATYSNNRFEFAVGYVSIFSLYSFVTGNHLINHPQFGEDAHGLFGRSHIHMEANIVENMGASSTNYNDGESLAVEMPGGYFDEGSVVGASDMSITFAPHAPLQQDYPIRSSYLAILITDGAGMGQLRRVTSIEGYSLEIDRAWDVLPDSTSKLTLITPNDNVTFYRNTSINNVKGIWFYGNAVDGVAADNISIDSEGVLIYTSQVSSQSRMTPSYNIRVTGNIVTGVSRRSQHAGIAVHAQRNGVSGQYYAVHAFGIEITDNRIEGVPTAIPLQNTETPAESGIVSWAGLISSDSNPSSAAGDITNITIMNNRLLDLNKGISISIGNYGPLLKGNTYSNVALAVERRGNPVNEVQLADAFVDNRAPFWGAGSQVTATGSGTTRELSWDAAFDNVSVHGYDIYRNGVWVDEVLSPARSWESDELSAGQSYEYVIVAFDEAGHRSNYSEALRIRFTVEDDEGHGEQPNEDPLVQMAQFYANHGNAYNALYYYQMAINGGNGNLAVEIGATAGELQRQAIDSMKEGNFPRAYSAYLLLSESQDVPALIAADAASSIAAGGDAGLAWYYYEQNNLYNAVHYLSNEIGSGNNSSGMAAFIGYVAARLQDQARSLTEQGQFGTAYAHYQLLASGNGIPAEFAQDAASSLETGGSMGDVWFYMNEHDWYNAVYWLGEVSQSHTSTGVAAMMAYATAQLQQQAQLQMEQGDLDEGYAAYTLLAAAANVPEAIAEDAAHSRDLSDSRYGDALWYLNQGQYGNAAYYLHLVVEGGNDSSGVQGLLTYVNNR